MAGEASWADVSGEKTMLSDGELNPESIGNGGGGVLTVFNAWAIKSTISGRMCFPD